MILKILGVRLKHDDEIQGFFSTISYIFRFCLRFREAGPLLSPLMSEVDLHSEWVGCNCSLQNPWANPWRCHVYVAVVKAAELVDSRGQLPVILLGAVCDGGYEPLL